MKPHVRIINWRQHGADESYCKTAVVDNGFDLMEAIRGEVDWPKVEGEDSPFYVNDDLTFEDGQVLTAESGTVYRLRLIPVNENGGAL